MSNKTNDEKLKILRNRLAEIQEKHNTLNSDNDNDLQNSLVDSKSKEINRKNNLFSKKWFFYSLIFLAIFFLFIYLNKKKSPEIIVSEEIDYTVEEKNQETLKYNLDFEGQKNIAIVGTFIDETSAKAMVNNLTVKGFKSEYFFLPNKSNSNQEVYKVYIGPFENNEETNQWVDNLDMKFEIINLSKDN